MLVRPPEARSFTDDDGAALKDELLDAWVRAVDRCGSPLSPTCAEANLVFEALAETTRLFLQAEGL